MVKESLSKMFGFNHLEDRSEQIREINISMIKSNPFQPRKYFDPVQLDELAKSIKEHGLIQPIIVRPVNNCFELVAGERRLKALQIIGMEQIPAIIRHLSDREIAEVALIENLQREDLNYFEEAEGYKKLTHEFALTQEEIAKKVGKSQSTIANKLRLLKLPDIVKENLSTEIITERHARALLKLPTTEAQMFILKEIYENELNVRDTDLLVDKYLEETGKEERDEDGQKEGEKGKRIVRIFKDMRIYVNTIRSAVTAIENTGMKVKMLEKNYDEYYEVIIQIPKKKK